MHSVSNALESDVYDEVEWGDWLYDSISNDPDDECRTMAQTALSGIVSKHEQIVAH